MVATILRRMKLAVVVVVALIVVFLVSIGYTYDWTGFGEHVEPNANIQRAKTLWD